MIRWVQDLMRRFQGRTQPETEMAPATAAAFVNTYSGPPLVELAETKRTIMDWLIINKQGYGGTREEVTLGTGLPINTVSPALTELHRDGYLKIATVKRKGMRNDSAVYIPVGFKQIDDTLFDEESIPK